MSDDVFHLTPVDARRYDFGSALRGYDKARVDQFRDQVAEELERLTRANQELEAKAKGFHEQLRAFRERDKALNDALITAQQLRVETREQAEREAQLVEESRQNVRSLQLQIEALERARKAYLAQWRAFSERQLNELKAAEETPAPYRPAQGEQAQGSPKERSPSWLDAGGDEEEAK